MLRMEGGGTLRIRRVEYELCVIDGGETNFSLSGVKSIYFVV